jgi:hypothetical protein
MQHLGIAFNPHTFQAESFHIGHFARAPFFFADFVTLAFFEGDIFDALRFNIGVASWPDAVDSRRSSSSRGICKMSFRA